MKATFHERYGPPDVVELREVDTPAIEDNQVLVRVHASSVNPAEWYEITGPWFARLFGGGIRRPKRPARGRRSRRAGRGRRRRGHGVSAG